MIEINFHPSPRELRNFGLAALVASGVVGAILAWQLGLGLPSYVLWTVGPILAAIGLAAPRLLKPLFIALSLAAWPIGVVVGTLLLGITYYLVVTAVGLVFRITGRDPMRRRFEPDSASYWIRRPEAPDPSRYFRQF